MYQRLYPTYPMVLVSFDYVLAVIKDEAAVLLACAIYIPPSSYFLRVKRLRKEFRRFLRSLKELENLFKCQIVEIWWGPREKT